MPAPGGTGEVVWRLVNPVGACGWRWPTTSPRRCGSATRRVRATIPARGRGPRPGPSRPRLSRPLRAGLRDAAGGGAARPAARQKRVVPGLLRVFPPFRSRDEAELRINKARILEVGLRSAQGRGGGTEFDQLREYSVDDEYRRIDWSATARTGKPIVRTPPPSGTRP